jgi:non-ribosomal peptide synthetase component F
VQWSTRLSCEQDTRDNRYGEFEMPLDISSAALEELEEQTGLEKNGIFMTIELLAMAALNGKRDVMVAWVYNGRDSKSKENIVGLLLRELPAALSVAPQTSLKATFADIKEQLQSGISHSDYPYIDKNAIVKTNDFFYFIYQEDIYTTLEHSPFAMERVDIDFPDLASESALSVEILDEDGGLVLYLEYSRDRYLEADVQRFVDTMLRLICGILAFRDRLDTTTLSELFEAASLPFPRA